MTAFDGCERLANCKMINATIFMPEDFEAEHESRLRPAAGETPLRNVTHRRPRR